MQDSVDDSSNGVPGLSKLPYVGDLFTYKNKQIKKSELIVFLRPVVVGDPSVNTDLKGYRRYLGGGGATP